MASERKLAHFISGPRVHTYNATTVLQSVFEGKGGIGIPGTGGQIRRLGFAHDNLRTRLRAPTFCPTRIEQKVISIHHSDAVEHKPDVWLMENIDPSAQ
jgi:hypothetical protein